MYVCVCVCVYAYKYNHLLASPASPLPLSHVTHKVPWTGTGWTWVENNRSSQTTCSLGVWKSTQQRFSVSYRIQALDYKTNSSLPWFKAKARVPLACSPGTHGSPAISLCVLHNENILWHIRERHNALYPWCIHSSDLQEILSQEMLLQTSQKPYRRDSILLEACTVWHRQLFYSHLLPLSMTRKFLRQFCQSWKAKHTLSNPMALLGIETLANSICRYSGFLKYLRILREIFICSNL